MNPVEVWRKLDALLQLEAKQGEAIRQIRDELALLKDRVTRLETRDEVLIARAEGAAATAAAMAASGALTDMARRIGAMEERTRMLALAPPEKKR